MNYLELCNRFANNIRLHKKVLIEILCSVETRQAADDEIERSYNCLKNISKQDKFIVPNMISSASSYLPMNQPLYSLILNAYVVKLVSKTVYYRPPEKQRILHEKIFELFSSDLDGIIPCYISRRKFFNLYASEADAIIFTGKYENAMELRTLLKKTTVLIFNGSALNPVVVSDNADIEKSVIETINARLYNSGQDCMAPAAVFLHKNIQEAFLEKLLGRLSSVRVGDNKNSSTVVGSLIDEKYFNENVAFIEKYKDYIIFGGKSDASKLLIEPTVFCFEKAVEELQQIIYAPFFFIFEYQKIETLYKYLNTSTAKLYRGYISFFGTVGDSNNVIEAEYKIRVLRNGTLFDQEDGNEEFGGYGEGCSFVAHNGKVEVRPILLLRDLHSIFGGMRNGTI